MHLLMKRSCERVQASRNSCEKSRLGGVGRFGAVVQVSPIALPCLPTCGPKCRRFRRRPEETGLVVSFPPVNSQPTSSLHVLFLWFFGPTCRSCFSGNF